jgi:hypothetical protein
MSNSQHPRALSVESWVSDSTKLLAVVMCLPLVDGVFVAVVLGGALDTAVGILEVGLLIFGGSAMVAVILAEMDASPRRSMGIVAAIGSVVILVAGLEAALAPTIESAINMAVFERFAALVILAVAAATTSAKIAEYLPSPALIIALGFLATLSPGDITFAVQTDVTLILRAMGAASVGVAFGLVLAATSPWLRGVVDIDRFRFGSAVALGVLALSIVGMLPSKAPVALMVLGITVLLAFDPSEDDAEPTDSNPEETVSIADDTEVDGIGVPMPLSDGGTGATARTHSEADDSAGYQESDHQATEDGQERPPWL